MVKKKINKSIVILVSLFLCTIFMLSAVISLVPFNASKNIAHALDEDLGEDETTELSNETMLLSENEDKVLYLSDVDRIKHDSASFSLGNSRLHMAPSGVANIPNKAVQAKIEGAWYTFEYGVYAHANSVVIFDISKFSDTFKYFSAYVGLCNGASKSDGILVRVDFSQDGTSWTTQPKGNTASSSTDGTQFVGYNQDFIHFTYDVTGVKWIRLFANRNKTDAQDQAIWADAKLSTTQDEGVAGMSLAKYDEEIKKYGVDADITNPKLELLILQREFISRVGQYALTRFTGESDDNKIMLNWLLNDLDVLREFMLGGAPMKGSYYNSLNVLSKLYKSYKNDLNDKTSLNNKIAPNRTFGELCRTMMFSVALTHDGSIGSYLQGSTATNKSEPNRRYAIFKYMYQTNRFYATNKYETMTMFGSLKVEEMRYIMSNIIDDESIIWLNDYVQTRINAAPGNASGLHTPHSYVRYTDPNYNNPVFYDPENHEYFNNLFAVDGRTVLINGQTVENNAGKKIGMFDTRYAVPAGDGEEPYVMKISYSLKGQTNIQKVWMNFNNKFKTGSVCGGISKSGTNIRTARGIPAHVIGQPGHAAILYFRQDANGKGSWGIDNDVGGWLAATKGERHLLGWGSDASWQRNSSGTVVYFHLAQECLNDYDNLVKAEEYCWLAKVYKGDLNAQEKLYEKALKAQSMNLDAWYGLLMTYKANNKKTVADYGSLTARIADKYWNHPVPMHCLFRLLTDIDETTKKIIGVTDNEIDAVLKNPAFMTQIKAVEMNALEKAKVSGSAAAKSKVNWLIGASDMDVADFSFDGENAGCIVWADTYSDGSFTWKYSLDGKKTWKQVTFNDGDSHAYALSEKEISSISAENGIYVYIVGASEDNAYKISVASRPTMPDTLYANDWENRVIGVDGNYEWRYLKDEDGEYTPTTGWISYANASPDCSGDKAIEVRLKASAKKPPSEGRVFTFTADKDTDERKYISVSYLSVKDFSTESKDSKRPNYAVNAIDGNAKTYWHTDYTKNIKTTVPYVAAFLTVKIDVPRWISALEFSQRQYNSSFSIFAKNVTVYVSEDGEKWEIAGSRTNLENAEDLYAIHFDKPVYGQYVKLVMDSLHETNKNDGVFTTVSLINLYEDTTKTLSPTGVEMPSLSKIKPSGTIFAGLGEIIDEEQASQFVPPVSDGNEPSPKPNPGGWIAAVVIIVILAVAAVVVFVLYKRGIIKFKSKESVAATGRSEIAATEYKAKAKPEQTATETKAFASRPKTNTAEAKVTEAKPKTNTSDAKATPANPKANTADAKAT
ncbi:MAG: NPCBM/NEW2 domain-containing protein, partial [Clostridia bacterium]|nr:NPCBM/NEW2 domain-containing protein [Clostridia bacterium]